MNTKAIREIMRFCYMIGLSDKETLEIINKIIKERSLPEYIDKDAITLSYDRYRKHKEVMNKQTIIKLKDTIYNNPSALSFILSDDFTLTATIGDTVLQYVDTNRYDELTKNLIKNLKAININRIR